MKSDQSDNANDNADQPTEAAQLLHGEQAAVETHPQPESVALPGDTLIAKAEPADDDNV